METHEADYLKAVERKLRDVPRRQRRELLALTSTVLEERPTSASAEELGEALGYPWQHAERLREEHGIPAHVPWVVRFAAASRWVHVAVVLVPLVVAATAFSAWSWWTADPGISNSCSGAQADPGVTIESREAAGTSEQLIGYVDGAEVRLLLCLTARDAVTITAVGAPSLQLAMFQYGTFQATPHLQGAPASARRDPGEAFRIDPHGEPWERFWQVHVFGRLANCEHSSEGGSTGFDTLPVTYRYRGRTRTAIVDLHTTYSFTSPPDVDCPRPRRLS